MKPGYIKSCLVIGILFGMQGLAPHAMAASPSPLLIQSVQVGSATDASDEAVHIINVSSKAIDLKGISIEYKAATGASWSKKAGVAESRMLAPGESLVATSKQSGDLKLTSGLAQAGGNLRISSGSTVLDQLAWGTGNSPEGRVVAAPSAGQIIDRICSSTCQDTDVNADDFKLSERALDTTGPSTTGTSSANTTYSIQITELLPDPASPQTDARDEFVELYNAGEETATLTGWKIKSGKQSYKLDSISLEAGQYLALSSASTKLGLSNVGDSVSLLDASDTVVMTTPSYDTARSGVSFGLSDGAWMWLDHPTPNEPNAGAYVEPTAPAKSPKATAKKSPSTAKKGAAGAKATSSKAVSSAVKSASTTSSVENAEEAKSLSGGWILAILGIFAIGYGVYEYRPELLSLIARLRANTPAGRKPVSDPKSGRRR